MRLLINHNHRELIYNIRYNREVDAIHIACTNVYVKGVNYYLTKFKNMQNRWEITIL